MFTAQKGNRNKLYLMNSDGTDVNELAPSLNFRGTPSWSPKGEWVAVAADQGKGARLFKIPLDGGPATQLGDEAGTNPVWSPDGRRVVFERAIRSGSVWTMSLK